MSLESDRRNSLDELKRLNQPKESHPTQEEWIELLNIMDSLEQKSATQAALLRELLQKPRNYPTQEQISSLARDVAAIRTILEQAGEKNVRRISPTLAPAASARRSCSFRS